MKALLIISHGSRRKESNDEVRELAERIANNAGPTFEKICCSFLELTTPLIGSAISHLSDEGVTEIVVFPYFLAAGTHVTKDIPRIIEEQGDQYPHVHFKIIPHLGAIKGLSNLILSHIELSG